MKLGIQNKIYVKLYYPENEWSEWHSAMWFSAGSITVIKTMTVKIANEVTNCEESCMRKPQCKAIQVSLNIDISIQLLNIATIN